MNEGLLDTNVLIHAHARDAHSEECRRFLLAVEDGRVQVEVDPLVVHELTYVLPRVFKQMDREAVAHYILSAVSLQGVTCDLVLMTRAIENWLEKSGRSFVDAYLIARAELQERPIYTKNQADFSGKAVVPATLPA